MRAGTAAALMLALLACAGAAIAQSPSSELEAAAREAASAAARAAGESGVQDAGTMRSSMPIPGALEDTLYRV